MTDDEILNRVLREDGSIDYLEGALLGLAACGDMEEDEERRGLRSGAIANILVDIAQSFRQFNSDRSQWYREVLEVLTQAKEPEGSLRSEQPAAAPGCRVCGKLGVVETCGAAEDLNRRQWNLHFDAMFAERRAFGAGKAVEHAESQMLSWFGPCPEEP